MTRFLKRRDKIRKALAADHKIDALLITNPINIRYLTNFTGGAGCLLIQPDGDTLLSDPRFTIQIEEECPGLHAVIRPRHISASKTLNDLLKSSPKGGNIRLGFEDASMTVAEKEHYYREIKKAEPVPTQRVVEKLRSIKDKTEIKEIRKAIGAAHFAFRYIREFVVKTPDASEIYIRNLIEFAMHFADAEDRSFNTIVGAGARAALPHGVPGSQKIEGQSHLLIDWGCVVNGYMSDLTRVLIFHPKDKKLRRVYETVLEANEAAIAAIKPGKTCEEIDTISAKILVKSKLVKKAAHGLGHSFGLEIHEDPRFAQGNKTVLEPGMVLTVEPGIYLQGFGGVRIEDDILVTKDGCELLSVNVPKQFEDVCL